MKGLEKNAINRRGGNLREA